MVYSSSSLRCHASSQVLIEAETDRLKNLARLSKDIYAKLGDFRSNYVEFMDDSQISNLDSFISMALSNQSAEAKVIRRIQAVTNEGDWVAYVQPDEEIDDDDLKSQLKACS
jgi:hypothetical protein